MYSIYVILNVIFWGELPGGSVGAGKSFFSIYQPASILLVKVSATHRYTSEAELA